MQFESAIINPDHILPTIKVIKEISEKLIFFKLNAKIYPESQL